MNKTDYQTFLDNFKRKNGDTNLFNNKQLSNVEIKFLYNLPDRYYRHIPILIKYFEKNYSYEKLEVILYFIENEIKLPNILFDNRTTDDEARFIWTLQSDKYKTLTYYEIYLHKGFDFYQLITIANGLLLNQDVSLYANPKYPTQIMVNVSEGLNIDKNFNLLNYLNVDDWINYINNNKNNIKNTNLLKAGELIYYYYGIHLGFKMEKYKNLISPNTFKYVVELLKNNIDVYKFLSKNYSTSLNDIVVFILNLPDNMLKHNYKWIKYVLYNELCITNGIIDFNNVHYEEDFYYIKDFVLSVKGNIIKDESSWSKTSLLNDNILNYLENKITNG